MDAETIHRRRWTTLAVLSLSLLIIGLDNTILNVALPTLVRELGATASELQWMVDSYVLVFAGLLLGIEQFGLGLDFPARYRQAIGAVTADDVLRAVRTHWDPDRMSLVVVANLREAGLTTPP